MSVVVQILWASGEEIISIGADVNRATEAPMPQQRKPNDLSRSLIALDVDTTLIAVVELSLSSWLVAGIVPGIERQPLKKLKTDENALLALFNRWRDEAVRSGHKISRIAVAFEAGRDGFWLARWLKARGIEAHVIHASSVAVSREHRRAKTDRLDTELLKRAFVGWLRGERDHCKTAAIPSLREEDAKRPSRERESLLGEQSRLVHRMKATLITLGIRAFNPKLRYEQERLERLERTPDTEPHAMVRLLARVTGIGIETADLLVHEVLLRNMRDRRAVARYGGLTGSPDRSGGTNREKGMARSGNARVRRGMIQLAWRFLLFQKDSALVQWYQRRTEHSPKARKTMIVALARKLLIALWRLAREGVVPEGVAMRPGVMNTSY